MRKVILISLTVFIAVVAGGYCMAWYAQASQIRKSIEQAIAKANEQQKYITYDAIETSGFPSDVYVSIVRPHFTGRIDTLLQAERAFLVKTFPNQPQPNPMPALPEWNEDALLDGRIVIGVNALSDQYSLRISGNWQRTSHIGAQTLAITTASSGDSICTLQMTRSGGIVTSLWDYHALVRDNGKDFLNDFRELNCSGAANLISDAASHEKLVSTGPWRFYISSAPQSGQQQARLYAKISDVEVTAQGDAMMALQRNVFAPNVSYPVKYSTFGKQNVEIDFSYAGPSDLQSAGKNPPLDIKLSTFNITNQLYTSNITFFLSNAMENADRVARLAFKAESSFNEPYDAFLQDMAHGFIQQLYAGNGQPIVWIQPYLQKYTPDQLYAIISPAIPNLHSLGRLVQTIDTNYRGNAELTAGVATLSSLELSASAYGITGNGTAKLTAGNPLPAGQIVLICSNCARLVDDVTGYATRLQKAMSYFEPPEQVSAPIDPRLADGIKSFLKALAAPVQSNDPDKNSYLYAIVSNGTMGVTINNRNLNDVLAMYKEYIGSVLNDHTNAAPTPESPPVMTPPIVASPPITGSAPAPVATTPPVMTPPIVASPPITGPGPAH